MQGVRPLADGRLARPAERIALQQLKTTLLVDTASKAVLNTHMTTTRRHDTQIAPQGVKRNTEFIKVLIGDKGYDDQKLHHLVRNHDIRPLIKHCEFTPLHKAWNERRDTGLYKAKYKRDGECYY
jgi:IS5 family transposase